MSTKAKFELVAELRDVRGKGASRRLRRLEKRIPAIMYGGDEQPSLLTLDHTKVMHALENEAFYSHILTLHIDGKPHPVILKALQRHPYKRNAINHMDFLRIRPTDKIHMRVPIHFLNAETAPGLKEGGMITHQMMDIEINCIASELPEYIEVDLANLQLDQIIHLSDLKFSGKTESVALSHGQDQAVVSMHLPRVIVEEEPVVEETPAAEVPTTAETAEKKDSAKDTKKDSTKGASKDTSKDKGK